MTGTRTGTQFGAQTNAAVGSSLEDIATFDVRHIDFLAVELRNTHASVAWTGLSIFARVDSRGNYVTMLTSTGTNGGMQIDASAEANALAATTSVTVSYDVRGYESIRIQAVTGSSGTSSVWANGF